MITKTYSILIHTIAVASFALAAHAQSQDNNASSQTAAGNDLGRTHGTGTSGCALFHDCASLFTKLDTDRNDRISRPEFSRIVSLIGDSSDIRTPGTLGTSTSGTGTTGTTTTEPGKLGTGTTETAGTGTTGSAATGATSLLNGGLVASTLSDALFAVLDTDRDQSLSHAEFTRLSAAEAPDAGGIRTSGASTSEKGTGRTESDKSTDTKKD